MNVTLTESGYTLDGKWRLVPVECVFPEAFGPHPTPPQSLSSFAPDWASYQQGRKDGRADAVAEMRSALNANPVRRMTMSGQRLSYVQLDELQGELDAICSKTLPEPAS